MCLARTSGTTSMTFGRKSSRVNAAKEGVQMKRLHGLCARHKVTHGFGGVLHGFGGVLHGFGGVLRIFCKARMATFLTAGILCAAQAAAQTVTFEGVCASLSAHPNTVGKFTQEKSITSGSKTRTLKSNGTFVFSLDGVAWNTVKPFPSSLVVGMTSVIQTTPDGKKTVIDASTNQVFTTISTTLVSLYSGDAAKLRKNFNVDFSTEGSTWTALLTPQDKTVAQVMKSLSLKGTMKDGSAVFDEIMLMESSGEAIKYMFTNMTYPKELSSNDKAQFTAR